MEFKFEEFMHVKSGLSQEEQEEIKRLLQNAMKGSKQNIIGEKRKEIAEGFLRLLEPERSNRLEVEIASLHGTKDEARFRVQILCKLFEAFLGGLISGQELAEPEGEPQQKQE